MHVQEDDGDCSGTAQEEEPLQPELVLVCIKIPKGSHPIDDPHFFEQPLHSVQDRDTVVTCRLIHVHKEGMREAEQYQQEEGHEPRLCVCYPSGRPARSRLKVEKESRITRATNCSGLSSAEAFAAKQDNVATREHDRLGCDCNSDIIDLRFPTISSSSAHCRSQDSNYMYSTT